MIFCNAQVLEDAVAGANVRGMQAFAGALTSTMTRIAADTSVSPNSAAVKVEVSLVASQLYSLVVVSEKQTVFQVL